jgi:hypothetical protein
MENLDVLTRAEYRAYDFNRIPTQTPGNNFVVGRNSGSVLRRLGDGRRITLR